MPFLLGFLGLVFAFLICGLYVFITACVRTKEFPWFDKEKLEKTPFGRHYETIISADNWLKDNHAESVYILSDDCLRLYGLWVPAENPQGTMLLVHGYRSTKLVDFGAALSTYHDLGYNLLIPDQRSHGKSEGRYITFGVKESGDILRWIDYHNDHYGMQSVYVFGLSMGASTVMYLADKDLPENVKGIIADCGFSSPKSIITRVFHEATHLPGTLAIWSAGIYARLFAGFGFNQMDTRKILACSKIPILMIHGKEDDFVPCAMTQESYNACTGKKELLLVDGAKHGMSFSVNKKEYLNAINKFITETCEG